MSNNIKYYYCQHLKLGEIIHGPDILTLIFVNFKHIGAFCLVLHYILDKQNINCYHLNILMPYDTKLRM